MDKLDFFPLEDRVIVIPEKEEVLEEVGESGLVAQTSRKPVQLGLVYAAGEGRYASETGNFIPTIVRRGQRVLIGRDNGLPIVVPDENGKNVDAKIMREGDILTVVLNREQKSTEL